MVQCRIFITCILFKNTQSSQVGIGKAQSPQLHQFYRKRSDHPSYTMGTIFSTDVLFAPNADLAHFLSYLPKPGSYLLPKQLVVGAQTLEIESVGSTQLVIILQHSCCFIKEKTRDRNIPGVPVPCFLPISYFSATSKRT